MKKILYTIYLSFLLHPAFAAWPIFLPPDQQLLLNLNYIDTNQCPVGQGKLITNESINVRQYLCANYCPFNWTWVASSDNQCHDISEFNFKNYQIDHYQNESGTSHSVVTASYGPKNSNTIFFKYIMTTEPGEHWYCVVLNAETHLLSCANDT